MTLVHDHLDMRNDRIDTRARDERLLAELQTKSYETQGALSEKTGLWFYNRELAERTRETYDVDALGELETFLEEKGTLSIPIADGYSVRVDGEERGISVVAATEISADTPNHGDMSSMVYLRDHIQAASALMELNLQDPDRYGSEGKDGHTLLLSALHLMSTPAQLARFNDVIMRGDAAGQADWPHISLHFNDLAGENPNGWRNKQDSFQMLAYLALDAAERGFLQTGELADAHKQFLGSVVPLLQSVGFPKYENSGSWEEIAAERTSVMAIETALLHKMKTLAEKDGFGFLKTEFEKNMNGDFAETLELMYQNGLQEIGRRLPEESPDYEQGSVKHRGADAALTYVLMYDIPRLLADEKIPIGVDAMVMSENNIEDMILIKLAELVDPQTGGMIRYADDSYQRVNFHTGEVQQIIKDIKRKVQEEASLRGGEIDLDEKQALRGELTPPGREAAWTHPLGQLSAWAVRRSLREIDPETASDYRALSTDFVNQQLALVTGEGQWNATLDESGEYQPRPVPAYKLPECYVTYQPGDGESFVVPSPHTPLNWSSAMAKEAVGLLRVSTAKLHQENR